MLARTAALWRGAEPDLSEVELGAAEVQLGTEMSAEALSANHCDAVSLFSLSKATKNPRGEVPPQGCEAGQDMEAENTLGGLAWWI